MGRFEPTGATRSFRSGGGEITLWFPGGDIAAGRIVGHVRAALVTAAYAEIDRHAAGHGHPGRGFIDLSAMTNFDWEGRMTLVRWNLAHRNEASRLDVLSNSLAVQLGLRAVGLILGDRLVPHESLLTFEAAYTTALGKRSSTWPRAGGP